MKQNSESLPFWKVVATGLSVGAVALGLRAARDRGQDKSMQSNDQGSTSSSLNIGPIESTPTVSPREVAQAQLDQQWDSLVQKYEDLKKEIDNSGNTTPTPDRMKKMEALFLPLFDQGLVNVTVTRNREDQSRYCTVSLIIRPDGTRVLHIDAPLGFDGNSDTIEKDITNPTPENIQQYLNLGILKGLDNTDTVAFSTSYPQFAPDGGRPSQGIHTISAGAIKPDVNGDKVEISFQTTADSDTANSQSSSSAVETGSHLGDRN